MDYEGIEAIIEEIAQEYRVPLEVDEVLDEEIVELLARATAEEKLGEDLELPEERVDLSTRSAQENLRAGIEELRAKRSTPEGRAEARIRRQRTPFGEG